MKLHRPRTYWRMAKAMFIGENTIYEPSVMHEMRKVRGGLFVDVGANKGLYSIPLSNHFRRVVAIEPNPSFQAALRVLSRENIEILPYAISDQDGETMLYFDDTPGKCDGSADTILPVFDYKSSNPRIAKVTFQGNKGIMVKTRKLDSLFNEQIDLLKVDVEGAEFLVLHGALGLLAKKMVVRAMVELHNSDQKQHLIDFFASLNYRGSWVDPDHYYVQK